MIQGGWICRACWKSNRPQDDRCYRCKTPREAQLTVEAGALKEQTEPSYKLRERMDADLGLLALLVAIPMWLSGWLGIIGGVLVFGLGLLGLLASEATSALILGVTGAGIVLFSALWIFISRSVRRHARWAYAIAAIAYLLPSAPWLLGLVSVPREALAGLPDWYSTVQTIFAVVYLILGIGAVVLLIASFMRQDREGTSASTEPG